MKDRRAISIALCALTLAVWAVTAGAQARLGGGVHYLRNLGEIKDFGYENSSMSILGSLQGGGLLKLEADVEYIFDYAGTDEPMWEPSAWLLIGGPLYAGAGIGIGRFDGEWQENPFYALRAGVDVPLAGTWLDLFSSYRFQKDQQFEELTGEDLDSMTFGAILRFQL